MEKKYISIITSFFIGSALLIWFYQRIGLVNIVHQLVKLKYWQIVIIFLFSIFIFTITFFRWKLILETLIGYKIPYSSIIRAMFSGYTISYLTPIMYLGGEGFRIYILKKDRGIPLNKSLNSILIDRFADFSGSFVFLSLAGILLIFFRNSTWGIFLLLLAVLVFLILYLLIKVIGLEKIFIFLIKSFRLDKINYKNKKIKIVEKIHFLIKEAKLFLRKSPKKFFLAVFLSFLVWIVSILQLKLLLLYLGYNLSIVKLLIIRVFAVLSTFVPIPASLGTFEGAYILSFKLFNIPSNIAIAASLILRIYHIVFVSLGIFILTHYLNYGLFKLRRYLFNKYEQ
ncbi:flippase-like domain-containing protein [bacterium]|nr:flippase-like domain-containing protein [bacterium]